MKGDLAAAAVRLMSDSTVHTHQRTQEDYEARLSANNVKAVKIGGVTYESVTEASRQIGKSRGAIRNMIEAKKAHYA